MLKNTTVRSTLCSHIQNTSARSLFLPTVCRSKEAQASHKKSADHTEPGAEASDKVTKPKKTLAQLDEELRAAMEGRSGDGGLAGAELEGGKAVSMKRGVRDNMFRYI